VRRGLKADTYLRQVGTLTPAPFEASNMTDAVVPDAVARLAGLVGPDGDEVVADMDRRADEEGFPTVGPEVGAWLSVLARVTDADRIFEFGSGFGYSAYWFARGLTDGEIVLTEIDADELDQARTYFERGGLAQKARFEHGDAVEIVDGCDGPFDIVLIDNEKGRYTEALQAVEGNLRPGSLVLADNAVTASVVDRDDVIALLAGEGVSEPADASQGIAEYLRYVREHDRLETALLPLGEGVAVSVVTE
jgi:caffeoyl-CoA O-methyltransferase